MSAEVIDINEKGDYYAQILAGFPERLHDIYYEPEYLLLHRGQEKATVNVFHYQDGGRHYLYPFILRRFSCIGRRNLVSEYADVESVYGYGGPISNNNDHAFLDKAHQELNKWYAKKRIIAEFIRFHPLTKNHLYADSAVELIPDRETRSLDLGEIDKDKMPFQSKTRNMIKRAELTGIDIQNMTPARNMDRFVEIYMQTMIRVDADRFYHFNINYFEGLSKLVEKSGLLLGATMGGIWVAGAIFLRGHNFLHYHLSASSKGKTFPGLMNLILWKAALLGKEMGLSKLHLGGGRSRVIDDSLLRFKITMSTDSHQFYIGRRIINNEYYQIIKDIWAVEYPDLLEKYGNRLLCYHEEGI